MDLSKYKTVGNFLKLYRTHNVPGMFSLQLRAHNDKFACFFLKLGKCLVIGYISRACFHFRSYAVCSSLVNGFGISSVDSSSKERTCGKFSQFQSFPKLTP